MNTSPQPAAWQMQVCATKASFVPGHTLQSGFCPKGAA